MVYAPFVKLLEAREAAKKHKYVILFIDEFNRCDSIVKREIMNLVLNREINDFKLPDNVLVICACNPTSNFDIYKDSDYQVEEMDEAQLDRFRWLSVKSDVENWINWGMSINPTTNESYIDQQVIEYMMDREDFLNNITTSKEDIKTSPRSWEFVSDTYRTFLEAKKNKTFRFTENDFLNTIQGDVGINIASDFISFLEDNKNPLIKPEEIFEGDCYKEKKLTKPVFNKISDESVLRKNVLVHNCTRYIKKAFLEDYYENNGKSFSKEFNIKEALFIEILTKALNNNDLMYSMLLDLKLSKSEDDTLYLQHILDTKNVDILNTFATLNQSF